MLNNVNLQGRITSNIELKKTNSGKSVTSFSLAVQRNFKQDGEYPTDFINIVAWGNTAEFIEKYFSKGSQILVSGRIETRKWQDNNNNTRYATEVIAESVYFCEKKAESRIDVKAEDDYEEIPISDELPF